MTLPALIAEWLEGRRGMSLLFPPLLEARYEADTAEQRRSDLAIACGTGLLAAILLFPWLLAAVPDQRMLAASLWIGIAIPVGTAVTIVELGRPRPAIREGVLVLGPAVYVACLAVIFAASHHPPLSIYVCGVLLMLVFAVAGAQLRFRFALVCTVLCLAIFAGGLAAMHRFGTGSRETVGLLAGVIGGFLLLANRRLEIALRRAYALGLRETLRHEDLSAQNRQLQALAQCDPLTGLGNRRAFDAWIAATLRSGETIASLLLIDIDHFKAFNDRFGHPAGDCCLQEVGQTMRDQLRGRTDLIARLGGEEFAVLLPGVGEPDAQSIAERLRHAVALSCAGATSSTITVSIGVATSARIAGLVDAADAALYRAKQRGRNRVVLAS